MKKKLLALGLLISCLFTFNNNVNAVLSSNAKDDVGSYLISKKLSKPVNGDDKFQTGLYATATFGSVKAYCIDPGSKAIANGVDCKASVIKDTDFAKAAEYIFSSNKKEDVKATSLRIVAIVTGEGTLGFKDDTTHRINARCGYINAAFQAAKKAGYSTAKIDGLKGYKSSSETGSVLCTEWTVSGDEVINFAAEALKQAKTPTTSGEASVKPTAKVTTSGGKANIIIDNSKGTSSVKVNITCDDKTTGDCGEKTVEKKQKATFTLTSIVNDSKQCGTFTATMTYDSGNSGRKSTDCTEVTRYSCGSKLQDYAGCSKKGEDTTTVETTPGGEKSNQVTETIKDPSGGETILIKCDEKKKVCPYNDNNVNVVGDGNGLCNSEGKEVINIGEATLYTQDVESCIIDNEKFLVASSDNGVCKTYCVEDYSFYSYGLLLSSQDKDPETGLITITAGSYFNFENPNPKAAEKGIVKCYTKLDLNNFAANVEQTAQKSYADHMKTEKHSCSCVTDSETGITTCTDNVTVTTYTAHYANNKVTFTPNSVTTTNYPSSCSGLTDIESKADSFKSTYEGQINSLINELKSCTDFAKDGDYSDQECNSKVVFDYGFNMDPIPIDAENKQSSSEINYKSNCNGDYSKCTSTTKESIPTANLDLGVGTSLSYPALEYIEKVSTITADYILKGMGICNDYNKGTSDYPVDEATCKATEGTTWVEGWPVKYDTPQGNYSYEITVSDFGHIKDNAKCKTLDHYLNGTKVSAACSYQVNGCKDCDFICEPEDQCDFQECGKECIYDCVGSGCIYDSGNGLAINYQPISMINVDSSFAYLNDRYSSVAVLTSKRDVTPRASQLSTTATHRNIDSVNWGAEKGQATLDVIEDQGEEIYAKTPEYKVTLTPAKITEIKKQNDEESEGFLNRSLKCIVQDESMEYVTCTSKFLDELRNEGILNGEANFESVKSIPSYVTGYNVTPARKSGTGPAWK